MKPEEHQEARKLRGQGWSVKSIAREVGCSPGSVSRWVRDIALTPEQKATLAANCNCGAANEKRREEKRLRWAGYHREAEKLWPVYSVNPSFMFGLALYVGEGGKTEPHRLKVANCDVAVLVKVLGFFGQCGADLSRVKAHIITHDGRCVAAAERYWASALNLPPSRFTKTTVAVSKASRRKKGNVQPFGTCAVGVGDTRARQKVERWMQLALAQ